MAEPIKLSYKLPCCSLEHPSDPQAAAFERMFQRMNNYIRKEARRFIAELKARRLHGLGRLSPAEKKRRWGFHDDEIAIPPDASWDRVKEALEMVGNADQFDRIRDEALRLFDVPETVVSSEPPENPEDAMKVVRSAIDRWRKRDDIKRDPAKLAGFKYI